MVAEDIEIGEVYFVQILMSGYHYEAFVTVTGHGTPSARGSAVFLCETVWIAGGNSMYCGDGWLIHYFKRVATEMEKKEFYMRQLK